MAAKKRIRRTGLWLLLFALGICTLLAVLALRNPGRLGPAAAAFASLQGSVQQAGELVRQNAAHIYGEALEFEALRAENEALRDELATLKAERRQAKAALSENERLYALLGFSATRQDLTLLPARVLSHSQSNWGRSLQLDQGTASDVAVGDCVIDARGALVGLVSACSERRASIRLVSDAAFSLGGSSAESFEAGILSGDLAHMPEGRLLFTHLRKDGAIAIGEEVLTLASQGIYPNDLLVGTVESLSLDPSGLHRTALIRPAAELDGLTQVFIVTDFL